MTEPADIDLGTAEERARAFDRLTRRVREMGFETLTDALDDLQARMEER